ncbi:MAG TPA: hypothetical protein VKJ00_07815 [Thermoanaerobaculia bacterium]|nr:hypothetical protein [Thermoanaerobaculia bacterium]HMF09026.1 hypothetical protein [Thermoanaerobaculia bacterium]
MSRPPGEAEEALTRAYRDLQTPGSERCLDAEALADLALGEPPPLEQDRLADHVVSCRRCSENFQILARTHREVSRESRPARSARLRWAAAAAVLVAAVGAALLWRSSDREEGFRGRAREGPGVTPAEGSNLAGPPDAFAWPPRPGAEGYSVRLFAAGGDRLWEADAGTALRVELPQAMRSRLKPGEAYFWSVEVRMPTGAERLGPFSFTLRR